MSDPGRSVPGMVIDCDSCQVAGLACQDCVVSVLLGVPSVPKQVGELSEDSDGASVVHLDDEHAQAIEALAAGGMVPPLRLRRCAG